MDSRNGSNDLGLGLTQLAILIPVLDRAEQIPRVLDSIAKSTSLDYRVVLICSPSDTEVLATARGSEADTIVTTWEPGKADFAKKINLAYRHTEEEWLLQAATDLSFKPGWDTHALRAARGGFGVVGTNDLGNALVKRGHHSTHTLFTRAYIETFGGTVDNSGVVFSEHYDHQFCDNEFIQTAMARQQFVFSPRSIIEHLHVHWGKAPMDATYEKATRATLADRTLFQKRMRLIGNRTTRQMIRQARLAARDERLAARAAEVAARRRA